MRKRKKKGSGVNDREWRRGIRVERETGEVGEKKNYDDPSSDSF